MTPTDTVKKAFALPFKGLAMGADMLVRGRLLKRHTGAQYASKSETRGFLSAANGGLLIDGRSLRLSDTESFQNVCVIAGIGAGKTRNYIIPNVLDKADRNASMVINDPKGEVFAATAGALSAAGYKIIVLNPEDPARSHRFNPLIEAQSEIEIEQMAELIIRAGNPHDKDPFWNNGAIRMAAVFLKALAYTARATGRDVFTLANLAVLFKHFGANGRALEPFMLNACINPSNPSDPRLWDDWMGCLTGNTDGIASFALNGVTATRAMSNPNITWMTARSDFALAHMREKRTALFLITPAQHADYYSFLTSVVMRALLNGAMRHMPGPKELPVYFFLDEFATMTIPGFVATANTIRAYKVSLSIALQSIAQLNARYGADQAHAIAGGFKTFMTYPGSDLETTQLFERLIGKVRERERPSLSPTATTQYREFNLINQNEVRTLKAGHALVVSLNRNPVILRVHPVQDSWRFRRLMARRYAIPRRTPDLNEIERIRL